MGFFDKFRQKSKSNTESEQIHFVPGVGRMPYPAYRGKEPYIFISYCHANSELVFAEVKRLNELGYHVWYDEGISPGNEWTEEIAYALEHCSVFLVMFTPDSARSDNVQNEIDFALDDKKPCVGIYLKETVLQGRTRLRFGMKQAIMKYSMSEDEYVYKLTSALESFGLCGKNFVDTGIAPSDTSTKVQNEVVPVKEELNDSPEDAIKRANGDLVRVDGFDIEHGFLKGYYGQEKNIRLPNAAVILGYGSFGESQRFIESVDLNKVGCLLDGAFENCQNLHTVKIPETVTTIKMNAFIGCPNLTLYVRKKQLPEGFEARFRGKEIVYLDQPSKAAPTAPIISVPDMKKKELISAEPVVSASTDEVKRLTSQTVPSFVSNVRIPSTEGNKNNEETYDSELKEHPWGSFVPRGTAQITMSDGTKIEAIANSLLCYTAKMEKNFCTTPRLYAGLDNYHDDNNYHLEDMILFADMQSIKRQGDILLITDYDEETTEIRLVEDMTFWCLDGGSKNKYNSITVSEIDEVIFNRMETPDFSIGICKITMQDGVFTVPSAYLNFLIDFKNSPFPNMKITTDLVPLSGYALNLKRIRTFSVVKIIKAAEMYSPETEAEIEGNLKNGETYRFTFKRRISIYALTGNGVLRCFGIQNLKSIELL